MMIILDIFICALLFTVPSFVLYLKNKKGIVNFTTGQIILNVIIGLYFAATYILFRYFHKPWKAFSPLHNWGILIAFILPFILAYFCRGTKTAKPAAIIMSGLIFLSPLTRPIFLPLVREMDSVASWDMAIPFNLCNVSALFYIVAILTNNKTLKNYMITFGLFGGIINNIQAHNADRGTFWFYLTAESYIVHIFIIVIPIFMLLTGQIKPSVKHTFYNALWILTFFLLAGFILNPLWKTNFHFTGPIAFTRPFAPMMTEPWIIFGTAVDPIYMAFMLAVTIAAAVILYLASLAVYKYFRPYFTSNRK